MSDLLLIAHIGAQAVALDATMVEAVVDLDAVEPVPFAKPPVVGLAAIRSQVVTVIDCSLAVGAEALPTRGRAVIVLVEGHRYALRLSEVEDVVAVPSAQCEAATSLDDDWAFRTRGRVDLGSRFALLLDIAAIIAPVDYDRAA